MSTIVSKILTYNLIQSYLLKKYSKPIVFKKVFKNTYFEERLLTAASDFLKQLQNSCFCIHSFKFR